MSSPATSPTGMCAASAIHVGAAIVTALTSVAIGRALDEASASALTAGRVWWVVALVSLGALAFAASWAASSRLWSTAQHDVSRAVLRRIGEATDTRDAVAVLSQDVDVVATAHEAVPATVGALALSVMALGIIAATQPALLVIVLLLLALAALVAHRVDERVGRDVTAARAASGDVTRFVDQVASHPRLITGLHAQEGLRDLYRVRGDDLVRQQDAVARINARGSAANSAVAAVLAAAYGLYLVIAGRNGWCSAGEVTTLFLVFPFVRRPVGAWSRLAILRQGLRESSARIDAVLQGAPPQIVHDDRVVTLMAHTPLPAVVVGRLRAGLHRGDARTVEALFVAAADDVLPRFSGGGDAGGPRQSDREVAAAVSGGQRQRLLLAAMLERGHRTIRLEGGLDSVDECTRRVIEQRAADAGVGLIEGER